ncbi:hypothetical protein [Saccharothrix sp. NRRL B-16348]|uniref:hypothetical protein n=1 Tax=Saccharothrix sp. NRRL B-16348 TaxID=1415542 RepID=UPI0006AE2F06|nr:hypothetical protein [Saccharothrix sp. NRRL B-16348]
MTFLDERTEGRVSRWVDQGWITVTDGEVIDYEKVEADIVADTGLSRVADMICGEISLAYGPENRARQDRQPDHRPNRGGA